MGKRKYIHRIEPQPQPVTNWQELPVLLDLPTVARLLGKKVECLRRLAAAGEIPATKACGEWRIRKDEIMLTLGFTPAEVERYAFGMDTPAMPVTIVERSGKHERMYDLA